MKSTRTPTLEIAYEEHGPADGPPVILMHGFPYDPRCYDEVAPPLAADGCRVLVPYVRGYGPTRFLSADMPRSGEQAAFGNDLLQFMDALGIKRATLVGYDWGGRGACVVSALWPERVRALVSCTGYIQHPGHRGLGEAGRGGTGASALVPVLLPYRARRGGLDPEPPRHLPAAVEAVVARMALR
jgi:pimeloyl-ACP methyl ester carboxylesterase